MKNFSTGKFVPFKTPLDDKFLSKLEPCEQFTPQMAIDEFNRQGLKIGLWINLTYTDKYYDPSVVKRNGIAYWNVGLKFNFRNASGGHQVIKFLKVCKNFIKMNPTLHIGVHCKYFGKKHLLQTK